MYEIHTLFFRETMDVKDLENPSNLAYTNKTLLFHTDQPYKMSPPHVSFHDCFFQCEESWKLFPMGKITHNPVKIFVIFCINILQIISL